VLPFNLCFCFDRKFNNKVSRSFSTSTSLSITPKPEIIDVLVKYINNGELPIVINSILALGIIGAGTNNNRILDLLEEQKGIFRSHNPVLNVISISKGLITLSLGTHSISYTKYERITDGRAFCSLLVFLMLFFDIENYLILNDYPFLSYILTKAFNSKIVFVVDENLEFKNVEVGVGQPVDVTGAVGAPKPITSIQVQNSPVIRQENEKCEVHAEVISDFVEDVVVMK